MVSFYSFLRVPMNAVRVCIGPVCDCLGAKELLASRSAERRPLGSSASATATSRPVLMRGDEVEPAVVHRTNDGPRSGSARRTRRWPTTRRAAGSTCSATSRRRADRRGAQGVRPHRLRRRRLPDRRQVGGRRARAGPALRRRQRRRGRAGDDQGPLRDGAPAAPHARGDADRDALRARRRRASSTCARSTRPRARGSARDRRVSGSRPARRALDRARRRRRRVHLRRGDGDARVDGGPARRCRG